MVKGVIVEAKRNAPALQNAMCPQFNTKHARKHVRKDGVTYMKTGSNGV